MSCFKFSRTIFVLMLCFMVIGVDATIVRIKNKARVLGNDTYDLVGYGLVTGLAGTGDSDEELVQTMVADMLINFDRKVEAKNIKANNVAVVMVTATVRNSAHKGDLIDVKVSTLGDATSLTGGNLLLTALKGPDLSIWATGQGMVTNGGFSFGGSDKGGGSTKVKNHPTVGEVTEKFHMERDVNLGLKIKDKVTLCLDKPDFSNTSNMAKAINKKFPRMAKAQDASTVVVNVPKDYRMESRVLDFISELEQIEFVLDNKARITFNERSGTISFTGDIKIDPTAITHGNVFITIKNTEAVAMPSAFSTAKPVKLNDQQTEVSEEVKRVYNIPEVVTIGQLTDILNKLGVTPRDIMLIMQNLKKAGALHAELRSE